MNRKSILVFLTALLFSVSAWAGLGQIVVRSHLGEPFRAVVPIDASGGQLLGQLHVGLAGKSTFDDLNVDYEPEVTYLRFAVQLGANGPEILIHSDRPIQSSYLQFVLELNSPAGRSVRAYTVLLDTPDFVPPAEGEAVPVPAAARYVPLPAESNRADAPRPSPAASVRVPPGGTLASVASQIKPAGVSLNQAMASLYLANPSQFSDKNPLRLRHGALLRVPGAARMRALSETRARATLAPRMIRVSNTHGIVPAKPLALDQYRTDGNPNHLGPGTASAPASVPALTLAQAPQKSMNKTPAKPMPGLKTAPGASASAPLDKVAASDASSAEIKALQQQIAQRAHQLQSADQHVMQLQLRIDALEAGAAQAAQAAQSSEKALLIKGGMGLAGILALAVLVGIWLRRRRGRAGKSASRAPLATTGISKDEPGDNDPITLADAHLAAGDDDKAEAVLIKGLQLAPTRQDIRYKLMTLYAARPDRVRFEHLAREVHEAYDGRGAMWERARVMGIGIDPDNPLYQVTGAPAEAALDFSGLEPMATASPSNAPLGDVPLDSMLNFEQSEPVVSLSAPDPLPETSGKDLLNFDFSMENPPAAPVEEAPAVASAPSMEPAGAPADRMLEEPVRAETQALPEPDRGSMQSAAVSTPDLDALDEPSQAQDEVKPAADDEALATKLDLARVYLDMGDSEGAREVLQELIQEADGPLKQAASELLMQLVN